MANHRSLIIEGEAYRWTGDNTAELLNFMGKRCQEFNFARYDGIQYLVVLTNNAKLAIAPGSWLVSIPTHYSHEWLWRVMSNDIFIKLYGEE